MNFYTFLDKDGKPMDNYIKAFCKTEARQKATEKWGDKVDLKTCMLYKGIL